MCPPQDISWVPNNFLALPDEKSSWETSQVVLMPVPYDSTTSYRTGTREGPGAILKASYNLEDYDHDLGFDVTDVGIHTTSALEPDMNGPRAMVGRVKKAVQQIIGEDKLVGLLGGEHTITVGSIMAMSERHSDLTVLYLDAHGDLRDQYMGSKWGHATVARRVVEMCPVTQVGIRSISLEEKLSMPCEGLTTLFWKENSTELPSPDELLSNLSEHIYISVDLDVLDPSIMAAVGTPEPGGMLWWQIIELLEVVSRNRKIVGFDITELNPTEGPDACAYLAAKLAYKIIAFANHQSSNRPAPEHSTG